MNFGNSYKDIQNIAVVRTDRLGDMILTLPMCRGIKEISPKCNLTLIARKYVEPLLYECEYIDNVIFIENYNNDFRKIFRFHNPELAFFPRPRFNEVYWAYKSGVPHRVGSAYRWYSFLFSHKVKDHRKVAKYNEAKYNLRMVESFFNCKLELHYVKVNVKQEALKKVRSMLDTLNININKFVVLHPGSGGSTIVWPPYKFGELADLLIRFGYDVIITGTEKETQLGLTIQEYAPSAKSIMGRLDLYEIIALISISKGLVANSTGILHIASTLEIPTVGLFPNSPHLSAKRWGPIGPFSSTLSPQTTIPEKIDDMSLIKSEDVFKELITLISKSNL
ncbi:MAG: glycosyltransferase family 9 protein [Ignavibacteria bacterium]|nr:glycosyltransferase family 9 protein [Ignavibacteria bacterium]